MNVMVEFLRHILSSVGVGVLFYDDTTGLYAAKLITKMGNLGGECYMNLTTNKSNAILAEARKLGAVCEYRLDLRLPASV